MWRLGLFREDMKAFRNPAVFKEIKGRQYLGYRALFRDADRLTFGAGLIGISLHVALCRRLHLYSVADDREGTQRCSFTER